MKSNLNAAFWKWFGDSVVRNEDGTPKVVYHGTPREFLAFDPSLIASQTDSGDVGAGFYFAEDMSWAMAYGKRLISAYLRIENPFVVSKEYVGESDRIQRELMASATTATPNSFLAKVVRMLNETDPSFAFNLTPRHRFVSLYDVARAFGPARFTQSLMEHGYDGVLYLGEYVVFRPEQIKSIDNDGTWDADDPSIRSNPPVHAIRYIEQRLGMADDLRFRDVITRTLNDEYGPERLTLDIGEGNLITVSHHPYYDGQLKIISADNYKPFEKYDYNGYTGAFTANGLRRFLEDFPQVRQILEREKARIELGHTIESMRRLAGENWEKYQTHLLSLDGEEVYLRYGAPPDSGRSWNGRDNKPELGVSAYRGRITKEGIIVYPSTDMVSAFMIRTSGRPMYVTKTASFIDKYGADGEPLVSGGKWARFHTKKPIYHVDKEATPSLVRDEGDDVLGADDPRVGSNPDDFWTGDQLSRDVRGNVFELPEGTLLYHGSPEPYASQIRKHGKLTWGHTHKPSGGSLNEGGLIFFTTDRRIADIYARRSEIGREIEGSGSVFVYRLSNPILVADYYMRLNQEQADILNRMIPLPDYKALREGDQLRAAAYRAHELERVRDKYPSYRTEDGEMMVIWPAILKALGFDAYAYENSQIAVPAEEAHVIAGNPTGQEGRRR